MSRFEALQAASDAKDGAAVRRLLADLPEDDRAELVPLAREIVAREKRRGFDAARELEPTLLVAYGILPASDLTKLGWRSNWVPKDLAEVLRARSPDRLAPIVAHLLDDIGGGRVWAIVRPLVREGIVPRPDRASYTIEMLASVAYREVAELIAGDPGLTDVEVWRLFEVEGGGEHSLANHEKFFGDRWGNFFRDLAQRDPAARERLLDVSLAALGRDFPTYRAGWFSRFHESLVPTDEERGRRSEAYLGLLRSRVGPTVSFATAALTKIDRAGLLPADAVLGRIGPVLADGSVGAAKAGLGLVGRAGARSAEDAPRAAIVATEALAHEAPEIQRAAIDLIAKLVRDPEPALARAIEERLAGVASSQRSAAAALAARLGGDAAAAEATATATTAPAPATATPAPAVTTTPSRAVSPIDEDRAIEPVTTVEGLVDLAVSVVETGEPADDVERLLDGVGTLGAERPASFERLTAALAKRSRTVLERREGQPFTGRDPRADVAAVLLAWSAGVLPAKLPEGSVQPGAGAFLSARALEIAEAVASRRRFAGVATPTHRGGWIDPAALVARLAARPPASTIDLVAGLLRLAPAGREAALTAARSLDGEAGAVVRYALGGEEPIGRMAAWWVADARVRAPGRDDLAVEERHPNRGPDAGRAARIRLTAGADSRKFIDGIKLEVEPPANDNTTIEFPTVLMLSDQSSLFWMGHTDAAMLRWIATIQPGYRETWSAVGALAMARNLDWWTALWGNRASLEPFVDPVTEIGPQSRLLIGIALGAKEAGERGLANDVAALALADGRLTAATLAEGLVGAAALGRDRPNRWALSLAAVAAHAAGHAVIVADVIGRTLPALADRPAAKLVPLLRLFDELLAEVGTAASHEARPTLERLATVGGQAGRLARTILSRTRQ